MAKKIVRVKGHEEHEEPAFGVRHVMLFLFMSFLGALGLAAFIQGIGLQWNFGFKYGFFSYLLAFVFIGVAKHIKWMIYGHMHHCNCK